MSVYYFNTPGMDFFFFSFVVCTVLACKYFCLISINREIIVDVKHLANESLVKDGEDQVWFCP